MVIRSVAETRACLSCGSQEDAVAVPIAARMAFNASAASDIPRAAARAAKRAFSTADGRAVIEGAVNRVVGQLIRGWGPGDNVGARYDCRAPGRAGRRSADVGVAPLRALQVGDVAIDQLRHGVPGDLQLDVARGTYPPRASSRVDEKDRPGIWPISHKTSEFFPLIAGLDPKNSDKKTGALLENQPLSKSVPPPSRAWRT